MHRIASGDPALDAHFVVRLGTGVSHSTWIQPALELLARSGAEPSLDAEGDTLVLGSIALQADRVRQVLDGQKLQALMHLADQLHRRLGGPAAPQP